MCRQINLRIWVQFSHGSIIALMECRQPEWEDILKTNDKLLMKYFNLDYYNKINFRIKSNKTIKDT